MGIKSVLGLEQDFQHNRSDCAHHETSDMNSIGNSVRRAFAKRE